MVFQRLAHQLLQGGVKILCPFQFIGKAAQLFGHYGIQRDVGPGDGLRGAEHSQFELVAGKGQRTGPVPICGILWDSGHHIHANTKQALLGLCIVGAIDNGPDHPVQLFSQEDRDNGGRCLVGTQPGVVAGRRDRAAQELLILINALNKGRQEHQKLGVLPGSFAWAEEVFASVRREGPVVVLAGAVDTGKRLLVKQAHQVVLCGAFFHGAHDELVIVAGLVGIGVNGG